MIYTKGITIAVVVGIFFAGLVVGYGVFGIPLQQQVSSLQSEIQATKTELADLKALAGGMMNQEPQDVIIKLKSGQKVHLGKEAEIVLLVSDKKTGETLPAMQVIIGIERGTSAGLMHMMGDMFEAEDKGSGEYIVRFTPDSEGVYTIHTHVIIPSRSIMDNHLGIEILAEKNSS